MRYDNYEPTQDVIVLGDVETTTWIPGSELRGRYRPAGYIVELNLLEEPTTKQDLCVGLSAAEKLWIDKQTQTLHKAIAAAEELRIIKQSKERNNVNK